MEKKTLAAVSVNDWGNYPGIQNMVSELGAYMENLRSNFGVLSTLAQNPLSYVSVEITDSINLCISLIEQISAEVENVTDPYIDIDRWKMYLADLDTTVRCWKRLPAFYNTGDDFASMGYPTTRPYIATKDDTWSSIEDNTGIPWTKTAQVNSLSSGVEEESTWAGRELSIPISPNGEFSVIPGIIGSQLAHRVLGRDIDNELTLDEVEGPVVFQARLGQDLTISTTGAILMMDVSGFPASYGYIRIEDEVIYFSSTDSNASTITIPSTGRGQQGTANAVHSSGTLVEVFSYITEVRILPYTDTLMQGISNALEVSSVGSLIGGDYGAAKSGILLVAVLNAIKSDPRVEYITNVEAKVDKDQFIVSMNIGSVGNLTIQTLMLHYTGSF
jgi:hypothetical protein